MAQEYFGSNVDQELPGDLDSLSGKAARILADSHLSLNQKIDGCLELIQRRIGAERTSIALINRGGKTLSVRYSHLPHLIGKKIRLTSPCVSAIAYHAGTPLLIENINNYVNIRSVGGYRTNSCLAVPVAVHGKIISIVNFADREDGRPFTQEDVETIQFFLDRIAIFLENARLYDEIREDRKDLREKNRELRRLAEWKGEVFHMIVHDLKTPVNEIMANLDLLTDENLTELGKNCLDSAMTGCDNLLRMVNNLLDISKLQSRKITLVKKRTDLVTMTRQVIAGLVRLAGFKGVHLEDTWECVPMNVFVDETITSRALVNLLDNAIKYSPEGSCVRVAGKTRGGFHVVDIMDQGPGIPEEFHQAIFESYVQGPRGEKSPLGTGLGLSLSRMAATSHGGKILLKSTVGKGSCFSLWLPVG
jgi:two-component system sensor histidine kinase KdpD